MAPRYSQNDETSASARAAGTSGASSRTSSARHLSSGFVPIMTETEGRSRGHNRRRKEAHFRETDPYDISGKRSRNPWKRAGRILSTLLIVVGFGLLVAAAGLFLYDQYRYIKQDEVNEELAAYAIVPASGRAAPVVDWEALKAVNSDVVGWIQIPGTVVNFPVYQGADNDTYLHTDAYGEYSLGGQIFLDYQNVAPGLIDGQTLIYGHHLRNGAMFKAVYDMSGQEMFDSVSTIWYVTETKTYELEPLLTYAAPSTDTTIRTLNFSGEGALASYLEGLLAKSTASRSDAADVIPTVDRVFTLCTCNYNGDDDRTMVVCTIKSQVSTAVVDEDEPESDEVPAEEGVPAEETSDEGAAE